jgi:hypothetical protein
MDDWEKELSCAEQCHQCGKEMGSAERRVLSVYTHYPICLECKKVEEGRSDYGDQSKGMIAECITKTGKPYGNPQGYCFHHFMPYKC